VCDDATLRWSSDITKSRHFFILRSWGLRTKQLVFISTVGSYVFVGGWQKAFIGIVSGGLTLVQVVHIRAANTVLAAHLGIIPHIYRPRDDTQSG
jgi:hypothetical protein